MLRYFPFASIGLVLCMLPSFAADIEHPMSKLQVSSDHRYIVKEDGKPFFYLADTAWELFHRLNRAEAVDYLQIRSQQGFTVIQAVALAEFNGIDEPNSYGKLPLEDRDPSRPAVSAGSKPSKVNEYDYWDHVSYIVDQANHVGLYVAILPTWGSWVVKKADSPKNTIFTVSSAEAYGTFLGERFGKKGVIWILGGDRSAAGVEDVWRSMAKGIAIGVSGSEDYGAVFMGFHPPGHGKSSTWFHNDAWLDVNMQQTGHGLADVDKSWERIRSDYDLTPVKPVIDAEPLYEDHPIAFNSKLNGYSVDAHIRQRAYWDLFSGACGHTYGNHSVWQMSSPARKSINGPLLYWYQAVQRPGANQMRYLRELMESRPVPGRVPDQTLVTDELHGADHIAATRGDGYAFIYDAQGRPFSVALGKISGERIKASWFNPRSGDSVAIGDMDNHGQHDFIAPSEGFGSDWVLILDDMTKGYTNPKPELSKG